MERRLETDGLNKEEKARKPYHKPEVVVYGEVSDISRNLGPKGNSDGGGGAAAGPKTA